MTTTVRASTDTLVRQPPYHEIRGWEEVVPGGALVVSSRLIYISDKHCFQMLIKAISLFYVSLSII